MAENKDNRAKDKTLVDDTLNLLKSLEDIRRDFEPMVDDILTYIYHGRRRIHDRDSRKGGKTGIHVYDGTALGAVNLLTDGLTGYTISKAFKWFGYTLPQKITFSPVNSLSPSSSGRRLDSFPEVKRWLEDCEEVMAAAFLSSNIYDVAPEFVRDTATVGTVTVNADEDIERGRIVFSVPHFRECYIAENYFGEVDTHVRVYDLTLKQLVERFGWEKMLEVDPQSFKKDYEADRNKTREVIHARFPRKDRDPAKRNGRNKRYASIWIMSSKAPKSTRQHKGGKLILESGTDIQNFFTWRWRKNSDEWYGRSPAWDAFVDAMTANQVAKTNLKAAHKMVDPPLVGPEDLRGAVQRGPSGWTSVLDMNNLPRPLAENIQLPFGLDAQERLDQKIREHFHVDFFLMLSQAALQGTEMTATQVIEMGGEKAAVLGPRIGRMETEALNPLHDLVFAIELRAGRIPPPPQILLDFMGRDIEVEYLGPLAQAQKKLFRSQGIRQGLEAVVPLAQMFPEVLDNINPDGTAKDLLRSFGFPQKNFNSEETVKAIRQQRQQALEQKQALEEGIDVAKAMPAAGKEISPDSLAGAIMDQGQG